MSDNKTDVKIVSSSEIEFDEKLVRQKVENVTIFYYRIIFVFRFGVEISM